MSSDAKPLLYEFSGIVWPWMPMNISVQGMAPCPEVFHRVAHSFADNCGRVWALDNFLASLIPCAINTGLQLAGEERRHFPNYQELISRVNSEQEMSSRRATESLSRLVLDQVVASWTAFEALAGDLWEEVVNVNPRTLGKAAYFARAKETQASDESDDDSNTKKERGIHFHELAAFDFDLRERLGSYLRSKRKWDFNRLQGMRDAYRSAFGPEHREELIAIFENKDFDGLRAVEVLRNVIVHRSGVLDGAFLRQAEALNGMDRWIVDGRLHIGMTESRILIQNTMEYGRQLLRFVVNWHSAAKNAPATL